MVEFVDVCVVPVLVSFRLGVEKNFNGERNVPVLRVSTRCEQLNYESEATIYKASFPSDDEARYCVFCYNDKKREGLSGKDCEVKLIGMVDGALVYEVMAQVSKAKG